MLRILDFDPAVLFVARLLPSIGHLRSVGSSCSLHAHHPQTKADHALQSRQSGQNNLDWVIVHLVEMYEGSLEILVVLVLRSKVCEQCRESSSVELCAEQRSLLRCSWWMILVVGRGECANFKPDRLSEILHSRYMAG